MTGRKLFVAGSTGAVGRTVVRLGRSAGVSMLAHQRPKPGGNPGEALAVLPLEDAEALTQALQGCTTVVQLIGTMRKRFSQGDTYESSDIGTTRHLVEAARRAGTVDHLVLLSSVGAGKPVGAYLKAKAEAEHLVTASGIPYSIFRPSAFDGEGHKAPAGMGLITGLLGLAKYKPIPVQSLASAILHVAMQRAPLNAVLEGESLWAEVARAGGR